MNAEGIWGSMGTTSRENFMDVLKEEFPEFFEEMLPQAEEKLKEQDRQEGKEEDIWEVDSEGQKRNYFDTETDSKNK